ncbi:MAG: ATP-binding cassette domain-containing protein [Deltaproteobacteria bacterium]|jgi:energy-coupling factor transport system ATP-binding protein|nr:ATP-binding cassette domain-containing protein [Deltaproteobacteria bacterium]
MTGLKMESGTILETDNLCFSFAEKGPYVLNSVCLTVKKGESAVLMGPSGSGKSTLAYLLSGLYPDYAGFLKGEVLCRLGKINDLPAEERSRIVSLIFQNPDDQFAMETAGEEVLFTLENIAFPGDMKKKAEELLDVAGLNNFFDRRINELSGGEKQKLSLATALAADPELLILDEPLANLDPASSGQLVDILIKLKDAGKSFLIIDHRLDPWMEMLSSVIFLDRQGGLYPRKLSPSEIPVSRDIFKSLGLFYPGDPLWPERISNFNNTEIVLKADNLSVTVKKRTIINNIDLILTKGSLTSIIGHNGIGKTTLLLSLCGLFKINGKLWRRGRPGLVFQNPGFQFLTQNIVDEVVMSIAAGGTCDKSKNAELRALALSFLQDFGLSNMNERSPWQLSQGQQRRLAVLTMLAREREVLFLDEPTYAQDEESTISIMHLLLERVDKGLAALFVTHDIALARAYSDRIFRLDSDGLKLFSDS